jgi:hypothetical protein
MRLSGAPLPHTLIRAADYGLEQCIRVGFGQPFQAQLRQPGNSGLTRPALRQNTGTTDSACRRRATNASTCADD